MVQSPKCLPRKPEEPSSIPDLNIKRHIDPLARQPNGIGGFQANKRPCLENKKGGKPLKSNAHRCPLAFTCAHRYMGTCIHLNTCTHKGEEIREAFSSFIQLPLRRTRGKKLLQLAQDMRDRQL